MKESSDFLDYFNRKAANNSKDISWVSGYHGNLASISGKGRNQIYFMIKNKLQLQDNDLLLDVGCGAGFITMPLLKDVKTIVCLDALQKMLYRITKQYDIIKVCAMAHMLPLITESMDKVLCNSVFQYFPSYLYAESVLKEMYRVCKPGGFILIVDLPDLLNKIDYNNMLSKEKSSRKHLRRQFYEKDFFQNMFQNVELFNQNIEDYGNSPFRFNVLVKKES